MGNQNVIWGYKEQYTEIEVLASVSAGNHVLTGSTVPEGEVWRIEHISGYSTQPFTTLTVTGYISSNNHYIKTKTPMAAVEMLIWDGSIVLAEGDCIKGSFNGCVEGSTIILTLLGYKMEV